jgi:hypothetical protein
MLWMILQFLVYAYGLAVLILLAVFVLVASYLKLSGKSAVDHPLAASLSWLHTHSFVLQHRSRITAIGKHPPRIV